MEHPSETSKEIPELWLPVPLEMCMKTYMKTYCWFTRDRLPRLAPALVVLVALAISAQLSAQDQHGYTFIEFNTPGFQDTFPQDINPRGTIVGYARSASNTGPAFVRVPNGAITTFEAPGVGSRTTAFSTNPAGTITGSYGDASGVFHGFVRAPDGSITTFDAPGAGTGPFQGTFPLGINEPGTITGYYIDNNDVIHGFLRTRTHATP